MKEFKQPSAYPDKQPETYTSDSSVQWREGLDLIKIFEKYETRACDRSPSESVIDFEDFINILNKMRLK